ncbi:MAG: hypothetical protein ACR2F4_05185, partial [Thermoleophilaceae bacterium]
MSGGDTGSLPGTLKLTGPSPTKPKKGKKRKQVTLGSASFNVVSGATATVNVTVSKSTAAFVASSKKLAVTATASAKDALGRSKTTTGKVTLQPAKKKKKKKWGPRRTGSVRGAPVPGALPLTMRAMRRRLRSAAAPVHRHSVPQLAVDGALVALAYWLAFTLRFDHGSVPERYERLLEATIVWAVAGSLVVFALFGL